MNGNTILALRLEEFGIDDPKALMARAAQQGLYKPGSSAASKEKRGEGVSKCSTAEEKAKYYAQRRKLRANGLL